MAVTVYTKTYGSGAKDSEPFPTGVDIRVDAGHLFVYDAEDERVGIYAPGKWESAVRDLAD